MLHGHSFQKVVVLIEALTLYFYILAFWRHKNPNTSAWQIIVTIVFPFVDLYLVLDKLHDKNTSSQFPELFVKSHDHACIRIMPLI